MSERLSRKELYDLVWSEPMKKLSIRFGISDVALKKTCARSEIPSPDRGYWAKREAGKETFKPALPKRPPGMDDEVLIAGSAERSNQYWNEEDLLGFVGAAPEFVEPIEAVRSRIAQTVGRVAIPHKIQNPHPKIERLLREDEKRREKQLTDPYPMSWDKPLFDTPFERRRLRILNSLFLSIARMNGKPGIYDREAREIRISVFQQHLRLTLDKLKGPNRHEHVLNTATRSSDTRLSLSLFNGFGGETLLASWQDEDNQKLEMQMADIAVQIVLTAEIQHRESASRRHSWRVRRKAELEEEQRKRKLEAERAAKERQKRIEQARVDRLLRDAAAFHQAGEIRKYVEVIRSVKADDNSTSVDQIEKWSKWALAQADRIDPALGERFLKSAEDEDAS
jgi:hypothetical protein